MATLKIVTIGDSNTASGGYAPGSNDEWGYLLRGLLDSAYASSYTYTNLAVAGSQPGDWQPGVGYMPGAIAAQADIYVVMLGTNGMTLNSNGTYTDAALNDYEPFMRNIIEALQANTAPNTPTGHPLVMLCSPMPAQTWQVLSTADPYNCHGKYGASWWMLWRPTLSLTERRDICAILANDYDLPYLDAYTEFVGIGWDGTQTTPHADIYDGVHMDGSGHARVAGWAQTAIAPYLAADGNVAEHIATELWADALGLTAPIVVPEATELWADALGLAGQHATALWADAKGLRKPTPPRRPYKRMSGTGTTRTPSGGTARIGPTLGG